MTQDEIIEIDEARNIAVTFGTRMCDEHGDAHGEELYCVGIDDIRDIAKLVAEAEREACALICENFADQDSGPDGICIDYHAHLIRSRGEA